MGLEIYDISTGFHATTIEDIHFSFVQMAPGTWKAILSSE